MKCRFPIIEVGDLLIAVLLCETEDEHIGLFLHPSPGSETQDPMRRTFYTGYAFVDDQSGKGGLYRLATLGTDLYNLRFRGKTYQARWRDIYIHANPRDTDEFDAVRRLLFFTPDTIPNTPFRVPRWLIGSLSSLRIPPINSAESDSDGELKSTWVEFADVVECEGVRLWLGFSKTPDGDGRLVHYAWAEPSRTETWNDEDWVAHKCREDEDCVADWEGMTKDFGDSERTIRLSFAPCAFSPRTTLVLHVELKGTVYEKMQRDAGLFIPSRSGLLLGETPASAITPGQMKLETRSETHPEDVPLAHSDSIPSAHPSTATLAPTVTLSDTPKITSGQDLHKAGSDATHALMSSTDPSTSPDQGPTSDGALWRGVIVSILRPSPEEVGSLVRTVAVAVATVVACRLLGI